MSLTQVRFIVAIAWFSALIGIIGVNVAVGIGTTLPGTLMFFLLGGIHLTVLFRVFRGAPPHTVAEILSATDQPAKRS